MKYGKDPVAQSAEDTFLANNGQRINSPAGVIGYQPLRNNSVVRRDVVSQPQTSYPTYTPMSADERRKWQRRAQNREVAELTAHALSGRVSSWLDEDGMCCVDERDDLVSSGLINRGEHLRRFQLAYARHWNGLLSLGMNSSNLSKDEQPLRVSEAKERIQQYEGGVYIAPISWGGRTLSLSRFCMRERLFRAPIRVRTQEWQVGLVEYDRRLRDFICMCSTLSAISYRKHNGRCLGDLSGFDLIFLFMSAPSLATDYL